MYKLTLVYCTNISNCFFFLAETLTIPCKEDAFFGSSMKVLESLGSFPTIFLLSVFTIGTSHKMLG